MRARVFIGSSKEGLDVAKYMQTQLQSDFDCFLWTDDIFKHNDSFLYTLLKEASLFDFGLLIATKDDQVESRDRAFESPRDNVIFEFGLFLGRLGPSRSYVIQEKDAKLPSDLLGITVPVFERTTDISHSESLNAELARIKKNIHEKLALGELGLLPSTALAIGYFYNFVSITCDYLCSNKELVIDGKKFTSFELKIVLPDQLDSDIKKRAQVYYSKNELQRTSIPVKGREFPVSVKFDDSENPVLVIYDMPTTLFGIDQAINLFMRKGHIGKSPEHILLEERELRNFQRVLQLLIDGDAFSRQIAKVVFES